MVAYITDCESIQIGVQTIYIENSNLFNNVIQEKSYYDEVDHSSS
jgi:hypothetical protein